VVQKDYATAPYSKMKANGSQKKFDEMIHKIHTYIIYPCTYVCIYIAGKYMKLVNWLYELSLEASGF